MYDLIIIGGGPSGLNCGIAAARAGLRFLILEKGVLVNSLYHFPTNMTFFSTSKLLEIGQVPFISHGEKPTRRESLEYYRRIREQFSLPVHTFEAVTGMNLRPDDTYIVHTSKDNYPARSVVVSTGFYDTPNRLNIPGEDLPKVKHYYDDAHPYIGQDVLVIGAANSACDVALETWQKGARVTLVHRGMEISPRVKYWIRPNIENRIAEGSIPAYFQTQVREIRPREVLLEGPNGLFTIPNDWVLAMTGYQPNFPFLRSLGLDFQNGEACLPQYNLETLETHLPNVFLAGVVCGGNQTSKFFIENTRDHGEIIVDQLTARLAAR